MKTTEKVIRKSILEIDKELKKIDEVLNANPYSEIIQIRMEAQNLLEQNRTFEQRMNKEFMEKILELSRRERKAWSLSKKLEKISSSEMINRKVNLEHERRELMLQLFLQQKSR